MRPSYIRSWGGGNPAPNQGLSCEVLQRRRRNLALERKEDDGTTGRNKNGSGLGFVLPGCLVLPSEQRAPSRAGAAPAPSLVEGAQSSRFQLFSHQKTLLMQQSTQQGPVSSSSPGTPRLLLRIRDRCRPRALGSFGGIARVSPHPGPFLLPLELTHLRSFLLLTSRALCSAGSFPGTEWRRATCLAPGPSGIWDPWDRCDNLLGALRAQPRHEATHEVRGNRSSRAGLLG